MFKKLLIFLCFTCCFSSQVFGAEKYGISAAQGAVAVDSEQVIKSYRVYVKGDFLRNNPFEDRNKVENTAEAITKQLPTQNDKLFSLCQAIRLGNMTYIQQHGEQHKEVVNLIDFAGFYPIHYAVLYRSLDSLIELIRLGAKINVQDADGDTPLHCMARFYRLQDQKEQDILGILLKQINEKNKQNINKQNINKQNILEVKNNEHETPLNVAVDHKNSRFVGALLNAGANPIVHGTYWKTYPSGARSRTLVWPPLSCASSLRDVETVKALLQSQTVRDNINILIHGSTALHRAVKASKKSTDSELVKIREVVKVLLKNGANPDIKDGEGKYPYDLTNDEAIKYELHPKYHSFRKYMSYTMYAALAAAGVFAAYKWWTSK